MSDLETIKYDIHAHRAGLETKHHRRVNRTTADILKSRYEAMGFRVAISLNHDKDEDLFGEGIYD